MLLAKKIRMDCGKVKIGIIAGSDCMMVSMKTAMWNDLESERKQRKHSHVSEKGNVEDGYKIEVGKKMINGMCGIGCPWYALLLALTLVVRQGILGRRLGLCLKEHEGRIRLGMVINRIVSCNC